MGQRLRLIRSNILIWTGVIGTAITLFAGLAGLSPLKIVRRIATALDAWRTMTSEVWRLATGWIGITIPEPAVAMLNFVVFALAMAVGVRLKSYWITDSQGGEQAGPFVTTRAWRIAAGALSVVVLVPTILLGILFFSGFSGGLIGPGNYISVAGIAICISMGGIFLWVNGWTVSVTQIFVLSVLYSICVYGSPLLKATEKMTPGLPGLSDNEFETIPALFWLLLAPSAVVVVFSIMLRIAPTVLLRNRLLISSLIAAAMLATNTAMSWLGW